MRLLSATRYSEFYCGPRNCTQINGWAAKDLFHNAVKQGLLKENWVITADPLKIKIEGVKFEIDLAAEKVLAAQKAGQKIAVEIKSFLNTSAITDFHAALGLPSSTENG